MLEAPPENVPPGELQTEGLGVGGLMQQSSDLRQFSLFSQLISDAKQTQK